MKPSHNPKGSKPRAVPAKRKGKPSELSDTAKPNPAPAGDGSHDLRGNTFPFQGKRLL